LAAEIDSFQQLIIFFLLVSDPDQECIPDRISPETAVRKSGCFGCKLHLAAGESS